MEDRRELSTKTSELIELALLASKHGMDDECASILDAIRAVLPHSCLPEAVAALCDMYRGDMHRAIERLTDEDLAQREDRGIARQYLAMAYWMTGRAAEADRVRQELVTSPDGGERLRFLDRMEQGGTE